MALENPLIKADVIEVQEFPALARLYNVTAVPKTVINNVAQFAGALPEEQVMEKVLQVGLKEPQEDSREA